MWLLIHCRFYHVRHIQNGDIFSMVLWEETGASRTKIMLPETPVKSNTVVSYLWLKSIFLVLSHMFGYLEQKLLGQLRKSLFFLKSNFYVGENFKFQCNPFSNKKDVSQRSSCLQAGLSEMAYFIFRIFFNETWHIRKWAWNEKIIPLGNLKVSLNICDRTVRRNWEYPDQRPCYLWLSGEVQHCQYIICDLTLKWGQYFFVQDKTMKIPTSNGFSFEDNFQWLPVHVDAA
jgi:hypothetical protein